MNSSRNTKPAGKRNRNKETAVIKQDLIERSPVRNFENTLGGGVKPGEIGVIVSKKGLGKTSILVQLGIDKLLQGDHVVHVSFNQQASYVMTWYEDIFTELAKKKNLDKADDVKADIVSKRIVLNFNQDTVKTKQIIKTIKALADGGSKPEAIIIDGFDFAKADADCMKMMKDFARELNLSIWYSADTDVVGIPECISRYAGDLDVVLYLEPKSDCIQIQVLREHGDKEYKTDLKLDVKSLLIAEK